MSLCQTSIATQGLKKFGYPNPLIPSKTFLGLVDIEIQVIQIAIASAPKSRATQFHLAPN